MNYSSYAGGTRVEGRRESLTLSTPVPLLRTSLSWHRCSWGKPRGGAGRINFAGDPRRQPLAYKGRDWVHKCLGKPHHICPDRNHRPRPLPRRSLRSSPSSHCLVTEDRTASQDRIRLRALHSPDWLKFETFVMSAPALARLLYIIKKWEHGDSRHNL